MRGHNLRQQTSWGGGSPLEMFEFEIARDAILSNKLLKAHFFLHSMQHWGGGKLEGQTVQQF